MPLAKTISTCSKKVSICISARIWRAGNYFGKNVKKELLEEIGAVQVEETYLGKVLPDSGILANQVDVFMCKVSNVEVKSFYEGIQDVVLLNEAELDEWILKKKIEDGFTLAAYSLYKVNKANGRKGL